MCVCVHLNFPPHLIKRPNNERCEFIRQICRNPDAEAWLAQFLLRTETRNEKYWQSIFNRDYVCQELKDNFISNFHF